MRVTSLRGRSRQRALRRPKRNGVRYRRVWRVPMTCEHHGYSELPRSPALPQKRPFLIRLEVPR